MRCAWEPYINILPVWMRERVDRLYKDTLLEIRLRLGLSPELVTIHGSMYLNRIITIEDLSFCVNVASKYSPWASSTVSRGYITAMGGHRIGLCGNCTLLDEKTVGIDTLSSLCIRVARDFPGVSGDLYKMNGSILIIGQPGCGKTTLLRDLIRSISEFRHGSICVVDEKREIFPMYQNEPCFMTGKKTDILSGCSKQKGIEAVLRNMGPETIAIDEITAEEDCRSLMHAGWCGVRLLATAHAGSKTDLFARPVYKPIVSSCLFDTLVIMHPDKSWSLERMS